MGEAEWLLIMSWIQLLTLVFCDFLQLICSKKCNRWAKSSGKSTLLILWTAYVTFKRGMNSKKMRAWDKSFLLRKKKICEFWESSRNPFDCLPTRLTVSLLQDFTFEIQRVSFVWQSSAPPEQGGEEQKRRFCWWGRADRRLSSNTISAISFVMCCGPASTRVVSKTHPPTSPRSRSAGYLRVFVYRHQISPKHAVSVRGHLLFVHQTSR